jgi:hypothetical protein
MIASFILGEVNYKGACMKKEEGKFRVLVSSLTVSFQVGLRRGMRIWCSELLPDSQ